MTHLPPWLTAGILSVGFMSDQPRFSDDRQWWWNGTEWRPIAEYRGAAPSAPPAAAPAPPSPVAGRQSHGLRNVLIGCGLIVVLGIVAFGACIAFAGGAVNSAQKQSAQNATNCSPKPCANDDGFIVYVQKVEWNVPPDQFIKPEAGNQFARVTVSFEYKSGTGERHANPTQFVLADPSGVKHSITFISPSETWEPVNLTTGSKFGPKTIGFQVPLGTTKGTLVWTPSFTDRSIPL